MRKFQWSVIIALLTIGFVGCSRSENQAASGPESKQKIKIGFIVKSATEVWFQQEWRFAAEAEKEFGFTLVKIAAKDGDQVLSAIDNLAAQGAQGLIICSPDVKLGTAILNKTKQHKMKLLSVDDRLIGPDEKPLTEIHHLGISAKEIGKMVGQAIADEMKGRNWNPAEVGAIAVNFDELETARHRIEGAIEILTSNGFLNSNIFKSPWKTQDIPGAFDAATITFTQHPNIKKWVAFSSNDDGVLGVIRASEQLGIKPENIIGVGINGTSGVDDFKKPEPTGFFASVLLSPKKHGFETAVMMYKWIKDGVEPPKETWTNGILITRANFVDLMAKEGL